MLSAKEDLDTDFGSEGWALESFAARHLKQGPQHLTVLGPFVFLVFDELWRF